MTRPDDTSGDGVRDPADEPVFAEPWEAQAFALAESLRESGLLGADDWTRALAGALGSQDPRLGGADYYRCWLAALESVLAERGLVRAEELDATAAAWSRAAHATPHGQPIRLENDPEARADATRDAP